MTQKPDPIRRYLLAIAALGFLLRLYICFFSGLPNMHKDSFEYFKQADTLLAGGYTDYFPNGYPLMIALVKAVCKGLTEPIMLLLHIGMSVATIWFVYDIGRRISGLPYLGLLAALLLAVFPSQINYVRWLTTETPTAFFLLGGFFFYYRRNYMWAGLFLGFATVVRSNVSPVFLLLFLVHFIHYNKQPFLKRLPVSLIAGTFLPLLLIGSYCYWKTGKFSTAGNNQINILYSVTASGSYIDFNLGDKLPEVNTTGKALHLYVQHMKEYPGEFVRQKLANYWELWGFYASSAAGGRGTGSRLLLGLGNLFLLVLGLPGWWQQRKNYPVSILIIPFVVVTILHTMLFAMPRYTYPVEPFLLILCSYTIFRLLKKLPPQPVA
ncbi:MAG: glycosyltransferase family 39 protein [Bacteroidetes bacterium]|nr:glycosyltransferase family 39 protein [Bacteroidota bacterium]